MAHRKYGQRPRPPHLPSEGGFITFRDGTLVNDDAINSYIDVLKMFARPTIHVFNTFSFCAYLMVSTKWQHGTRIFVILCLRTWSELSYQSISNPRVTGQPFLLTLRDILSRTWTRYFCLPPLNLLRRSCGNT